MQARLKAYYATRAKSRHRCRLFCFQQAKLFPTTSYSCHNSCRGLPAWNFNHPPANTAWKLTTRPPSFLVDIQLEKFGDWPLGSLTAGVNQSKMTKKNSKGWHSPPLPSLPAIGLQGKFSVDIERKISNWKNLGAATSDHYPGLLGPVPYDYSVKINHPPAKISGWYPTEKIGGRSPRSFTSVWPGVTRTVWPLHEN